MQIDPTQGLDPFGLNDGPRPAGAGGPPAADRGRPAGTAGEGEPPVPPEYLRLAAETEPVRAEVVAEAKRLLEAGDLDTPEAARGAAEAILSLGI